MWGPKFTHNISLFYPTAILNYFGITKANPYYELLSARVLNIINQEVLQAARLLNAKIKDEFRKDIIDIAEYNVLNYWQVLDSALSSPLHVGVIWGAKLVQAKFIDTALLGGLRELQEIQHEAYPTTGPRNLGAWTSLYNRWLAGEENGIGDTLRRRLSIMASRGMAPFAELIETGNDMYPAYPRHAGKHTLQDFKPVYNREMRAAFQRVIGLVGQMIETLPSTILIAESIVVSGVTKNGYTWTSRTGNVIFALEGSIILRNNRFMGSGFILSPSGTILRRWFGWLPK